MITFLAFLRAAPKLIELVYAVWKAIDEMGKENFLLAVKDTIDELEKAKTKEERLESAKKIADLWSRI